MSKFKFYFIAFCSAFVLFSCNKSEDTSYAPLHYYAPQYITDLAVIETYLKEHYIEEIVNNPGELDDQNIKMSLIPDNNTTLQPIWESPLLHSKTVYFNGLNYKIYYLKLREGTGESPSRVDQALIGYDGSYLSLETLTIPEFNTDGTPVMIGGKQKTHTEWLPTTTQFEYVQYPQSFFPLENVIQGWREIVPLFKGGTISGGEGPDPIVYNDFGAGVIFIPSALAYYERYLAPVAGSEQLAPIPSYSPLVFKFKLYDVKRADQDNDGIISNIEDLNQDGNFLNDDTDGDGIRDFLDNDDDGDGYLTRKEISYIHPLDPDKVVRYYPYNGAAVDDPATPYVDERRGIPRKFTGILDPDTGLRKPAADGSDFTDPTRLRRHLDKTAVPPYFSGIE